MGGDRPGTASAVIATYNAANQLAPRGAVSYTCDVNGDQTGSSASQALTTLLALAPRAGH